jgi:hypothetical protein
MGVMNFFMQMDPDFIASMPETHRAIIEVRPGWATGGFALSVIGGAVGCLLLLLRKSAAFHVFVMSLVGTIMQVIPHFHMIGSTIKDPFEIVMMIVMPFVVAGFLIWYARLGDNKGWLR